MDDITYQRMDAICAGISNKLSCDLLGSRKQYIYLEDFNPKDEAHLFFLHIVDVYASFHDKEIVIPYGHFKAWQTGRKERTRVCIRMATNHKLLLADKIKINDYLKNCESLMKYLSQDLTYAQIYKAYFAKENKK